MTGVATDVTVRLECKSETICDDISRRGFLKAGLACTAFLSTGFSRPAEERLKFRQVSDAVSDRLWGVALAFGEDRLDLIDLDNNRLLHSFEGLRATHAITPIEHLNRFVVHGQNISTNKGAVGVLQVDPVNKTWSIPFYKTLPGGPALHWQPDPEFNRVVFNTIGAVSYTHLTLPTILLV